MLNLYVLITLITKAIIRFDIMEFSIWLFHETKNELVEIIKHCC